MKSEGRRVDRHEERLREAVRRHVGVAPREQAPEEGLEVVHVHDLRASALRNLCARLDLRVPSLPERKKEPRQLYCMIIMQYTQAHCRQDPS